MHVLGITPQVHASQVAAPCSMLLPQPRQGRCEATHGGGDEWGGEERGEASPSDQATSLPHGVSTVHAWRDHVQYSTSVLVRNLVRARGGVPMA